MKKAIAAALAVTFVLCLCAGGWAAQNRKQYRKNLIYNKNALPAGWKYEAGYTLWRVQRGLPANFHSYKRYKKDRQWRAKVNQDQAGKLLLDTADWTIEELALFWQNNQDLFKFHPAGYED